MAATTYTDQQQYAKFQKKGCGEHGHSEGCGCKGESSKDCGCCPPGLIATYDDEGRQTGCVTPNDAELYYQNIFTCKDGYVKLIRESDGKVLGCVSEEEFPTLYALVNPPA
jgi:hypothetical protein